MSDGDRGPAGSFLVAKCPPGGEGPSLEQVAGGGHETEKGLSGLQIDVC